ncbi:hypothetical protein [Chelativorans alearense]|uniref:hypothetical protein n=1 Tax=Chelativorans alearense TaxID=2681495 RepID=UPI001FE5CD92|nr:hypothetical protein [Chelativorans alearense]
MAHQDHPIAVIHAGPVGLVAVAHLVQRGLRSLVFERGASVQDCGHGRVFSQGVDACCAKNAGAKAHGEEGRGCATNVAPTESASAPRAACCRSAA